MTTMKAVRISEYGGPEVCKIADVEIPQPGKTQVLVKVMYAGINPIDVYLRSGQYSLKPPLPYIPGQDCAGIVERVGSAVTKFSPGDTVFAWAKDGSGTNAQYCLTEERLTFPLDLSKLSFQQGACLGVPYFTSYQALFSKGHLKKGDRVLVHGASGGVGTICVQVAKAFGVEVYGTAGTEVGLDIVRQCGADKAFNHRSPDYTKQIMESTDGKGVDLIVEMLADVNLPKDLDMLAFRGRIVIVGARGNVEINPNVIMYKEAIITAVVLFVTTEAEWEEMRLAADNHISAGFLNPLVAKEYSLEETGQAHHDIMTSSGATGNLVVNTQKF